MPIVASDLLRFSSANEPTDDTSTTGGARSTTSRPELTQLSANAVIAAVSDGADTRNLTIVARKADGSVVQETKALTGATEILFNTISTVERIESATLSATDAARTVTIKQGSGGATLATITPNETTRHIRFRLSASAGTQQIRYEKDFWRNNHATLALLSAQLKLTADPASKIRIGVETATGGSTSITNRKTAPAGITFVDDNVAAAVPGGSLGALTDIGCWIEQTLAISDAPQKSTYTVQLDGQTT